jgi:hypothetical protein
VKELKELRQIEYLPILVEIPQYSTTDDGENFVLKIFNTRIIKNIPHPTLKNNYF